MQDKYELRITLTDSTAISILKGFEHYVLKRKFIESAIIKTANNDGVYIDLFKQSHKKESKSLQKEVKEVLPQNQSTQTTIESKKELQNNNFEIQYTEQNAEKDNKSCFMFDFGES